MRCFMFLAIFAIIFVSSTWAQYSLPDDSEDADDYGEDRDSRQAVPYAALEPISKGCARARYKQEYCGGYGVNNWCDTLCETRGYPYSWCRPTYCLCHFGKDDGSFCDWASSRK